MLEQFDWKIISAVAQVLVAIATFAAVVVSLWLASRDRRVKVNVRADIKIIIRPGVGIDEDDYVSLEATNIDVRPVQVVNFFWAIGLFPKRHAIQNAGGAGFDTLLPAVLMDGESAQYLIKWSGFRKNLPKMFFDEEDFKKFPDKYIRKLRIGVHVSIGKVIWGTVGNTFREKVIQDWCLYSSTDPRFRLTEEEEAEHVIPVRPAGQE